ncbi:hypothetical protein KUTeg_018481 [Tegillarca granosa]|uniref:Major facilitator superfamily (MFS) profile domain-containing protein n=1 Tax=Tegillarca granosa TaxID=220873 RepID=A0ABQ9EI04_TEGGR|nr:hypothetical protein KUTeg_018481 [Tegillarca granosa]
MSKLSVLHLRDSGTANRILSLIGRGAITASFNGIFLYTPELFPTNIRNAGIGIASGFGRFAGMLAPFSVYLVDLAQWAPGVLFGVMCFIIAILLRFVPETKGKELAQTVEELKQWENKTI